MFEQVNDNSNGYVLPGWEPERIGEIKRLLDLYKDMDEEKLWKNLETF